MQKLVPSMKRREKTELRRSDGSFGTPCGCAQRWRPTRFGTRMSTPASLARSCPAASPCFNSRFPRPAINAALVPQRGATLLGRTIWRVLGFGYREIREAVSKFWMYSAHAQRYASFPLKTRATPDVQPEELLGWRAVVIGQEPAQGIHCGAVES
jgi:hypothetical protein